MKYLFSLFFATVSSVALAADDGSLLFGIGAKTSAGGGGGGFTPTGALLAFSTNNATWGQGSIAKTTALAGAPTSGGTGLISTWVKCNTSGPLPKCTGDVISTRDNASWPAVNFGINTVGATTNNVTVEVDLNANGFAGTKPEARGYAPNTIVAADSGKWVNIIAAWNVSGATKCFAISKNGTPQTVTVADNSGGVGFHPYYETATGWSLFYNSVLNDQPYGQGLAETYMSLSPSVSPCTSNVLSGIAASNFVGAGTTPTDLGPNCKSPDPTGNASTSNQPAMCFRGSTSTSTTYATNQGSGGAFTVGNAQAMFDASITPGAAATNPYIVFQVPSTVAATSPLLADWGVFSPAVGDLIIVVAATVWTTYVSPTVTTPSGYTLLGTFGGGASSGIAHSIFYKIAGASESPPSITITPTTIYSQAYADIIVRGASGIGTIGTPGSSQASNVTSITCGGYTPSQSGSVPLLIAGGGTSGVGPFSISGNPYIRRSDLYPLTTATNGMPEIFVADYINSGLTAVATETFTQTGAANQLGCIQFEVKH